jgi:hypothetical protein
VLESPVRSGLLPKFGKTETGTGCYRLMDWKKPQRTDVDRFTAVFISLLQF